MSVGGKDQPMEGATVPFTSADHWDNKWEKLKTWRTVQGAIISKLTSNEAQHNEDVTVSHGLKMVGLLTHPDGMRSLTCIKTMNGLVFVTNSGTDMKNYMTVWNVQGFGTQYINKTRFTIATKCSLLKYIAKYKKFIVYSPDQKLRLLGDVTRGFEVASEITTSCTFFCIQWNPDTEEILCGSSHGVFVYKIVAGELVEGTSYNLPVAQLMNWCVGIQLDVKNSQAMIVCDDRIYIYNYKKAACSHVLKNRHKLSVTCCVFFEAKDMLITASKDGAIKIWNGMAFTEIAEIQAHTEAITDLQLHRVDLMVFSCSLDYTVKVWRLDTYEMFMRIDVGDRIKGMRLLGVNEMYLWTDKHIKLYKVSMVYSFYAPVYSTVRSLFKCNSYGQPSNIVCSSNDGVVRIYTSVTADTYTTIFPQKDFQVVTQMAYIKPYAEFLIVLKSGDVVVYDVNSNPSRPIRVLEANVRFDEQVISISLIKMDRALGRGETEGCEYLVFAGHKNGEISLLYSKRCKLMDLCRAHLSTVEILETSESIIGSANPLDSPIGTSDRLVSSGRDMKVKIWGLVFEELDPYVCSLVCLKSLDLNYVDAPLRLCMIASTVAVAFPTKSGSSRLVMYSLSDAETVDQTNQRRRSIASATNRGIISQTHNRSFDHKTDINGLAGHTQHEIFISTSWDGCLKVWDRQNTLLREVTFDETLVGCCFADTKGTILVGYKNHISAVSMENYLPNSMLEKVVLEEYKDDEEEETVVYDNTTPQSDIALLPREPAVSTVLRNARMSRDTKSGWLAVNMKIQYRANSTYAIEKTGEKDSLMGDYKAGRERKASRKMWRKLGVSQRIVNMLSSPAVTRQNSSSGLENFGRDSPELNESSYHDKQVLHHSEQYPLPLPDFSVPPVKRLTKVQFDSQVTKLSKQKQEHILEERRRKMEVARQLEMEKKNRSKWYPLAPDGEIPNSVIRDLLDELNGKKVKDEPKLAFTDIAMLIAKLPGLGTAEKSVNDYLVEKIRAKKEAIADRKKQQQEKEQKKQQEPVIVNKTVVSLIPDELKMAMDCIRWCNDFADSVVEAKHFIMRGEEIVDISEHINVESDHEAVEEREPTPDPLAHIRGALEAKQKGLDVLKRMSKEPWWNNILDLTVANALEQIIQMMPKAMGRLHASLLSYLAEIHRVFGILQSHWLNLAEALVRNMHYQMDNEGAVLLTLKTIGDVELKHSKIIGELARMVQTEERPAVVNIAMALLKKFSAEETLNRDKLEELASVDDDRSSIKSTFNMLADYTASSESETVSSLQSPDTRDSATPADKTSIQHITPIKRKKGDKIRRVGSKRLTRQSQEIQRPSFAGTPGDAMSRSTTSVLAVPVITTEDCDSSAPDVVSRVQQSEHDVNKFIPPLPSEQSQHSPLHRSGAAARTVASLLKLRSAKQSKRGNLPAIESRLVEESTLQSSPSASPSNISTSSSYISFVNELKGSKDALGVTSGSTDRLGVSRSSKEFRSRAKSSQKSIYSMESRQRLTKAHSSGPKATAANRKTVKKKAGRKSRLQSIPSDEINLYSQRMKKPPPTAQWQQAIRVVMSDRNVRTLKKTTDKQDLSLLIKSLIKHGSTKETIAPEGIRRTTSARLVPVEEHEHFDKLSSPSFIQDPLDVIKKLRKMSLRKHKSKDKSSLLDLRRKHHARNSMDGHAMPFQNHPFSLQSLYTESLATTRSKTEVLNSHDEPSASESSTETSTTTTSNTTSKRRSSHTQKKHVTHPPLPAQNANKKTRKSSMLKNKRAFGTKTREKHRSRPLRMSKEKAMDASSTFAEINKRRRRLQEIVAKITASQRFLRSSRKTSSGQGSIVGMLMANPHLGHKSSKHRDSTPRTSLKGIDLAKLGYASQSLLQARQLESEIERNQQSLTAKMTDADNNMGHNLITPSIKLDSLQSALEVESRTDSKEAGHPGIEGKQGSLRTSGSAVAATDSSSRKKEVRFDLVHTYRTHSFSGIEDASKKLPSLIKASMSQPNIYLKGRRIHPRKIWRSSGRVTYSNAGISREDWIEPGAKDGVQSLNTVNSQNVSASYSFEMFKLSSKNLQSNKHSIRRAFGVRLAKKFIKESFLRIRGSLLSDNTNKLLAQTPEINLNLRSLQPVEQEEYYVKVDEQIVLLTKADKLYIATPIAADITTTVLEMEKPDILMIDCFVYPSIWLAPLTSFDEEGSATTEEVNWMSAVESERHLVQLSLSTTTQHYVATKITRNTLKKILKEVGYDFEPHLSDVVNELLKLNTTRHSIAGETDTNSSLPPVQENKHNVDGSIPVKRNRSKSEGYNKLKQSFINKTKKQFTGLLNQYIGLFHDALVPKIKQQLEEFGVPNTALYNRILEASQRQCLWLMVKTKIDPFLQPVHEKNCALTKQPLFLEALEEMIEKIELGAEQGSVILAIDTVLRLIGTCKCKMSENVNSMISNGCTEFLNRVQGENKKKKFWSLPPTTKKAAYIAKIVDAACDWLPQLLTLAKHYPRQATGQPLNVHISRAEASKQERPKREIAVARQIKTNYSALQTTMKSSPVQLKQHAQVDIGEHSPKAKLSSGRFSSAGSFGKKVDNELPDNEQSMSEKLKDEEGSDEETSEDDEKVDFQSLPKIKREARSKRKQNSRSAGILEDEETNSDVQMPTALSHTTPKINTQSVAASSKTAGRDSGLASTKMTSVGLPELEEKKKVSFHSLTKLPSISKVKPTKSILQTSDDGEKDDSRKGTFRTQLSSLMQMSNAKSEQWLNDNILPPIQQANANRRQSDRPIIDSVEKRKATKDYLMPERSMVRLVSLESISSRHRGGLTTSDRSFGPFTQGTPERLSQTSRSNTNLFQKHSRKLYRLESFKNACERPSANLRGSLSKNSQEFLPVHKQISLSTSLSPSKLELKVSQKVDQEPIRMVGLVEQLTAKTKRRKPAPLRNKPPIVGLNKLTDQPLPTSLMYGRYNKLPGIGQRPRRRINRHLSRSARYVEALDLDRQYIRLSTKSSQLKSLLNLQHSYSETDLAAFSHNNISFRSATSVLPSSDYNFFFDFFDEEKFTDEQEKLVEDHLKSLESDGHSFKSLHGMSEVAVTDLVRGLWNKPEETEEWHGKYKEHRPPPQAKTKGASVPRLPQLSRVTGGLEFQWDSPLPPAPGSKLSLTDWKDMHSKYCEYWRMVRKRMHHYTNTSKDVHSQSQQPPEDCGPKEDLSERLRLYPSHTDMTLRQLQTNTIDPGHWYPSFRYPSSFNIKESLPCATSSTLEVNDIS